MAGSTGDTDRVTAYSSTARSRCATTDGSGSGPRTVTAGPGETLVVPPGTPVTVTAAVSGAPGTSLALITAAGVAARAAVEGLGVRHLRWTTTGAEARFVRVEVRRTDRRLFASMVALSNPVWLG